MSHAFAGGPAAGAWRPKNTAQRAKWERLEKGSAPIKTHTFGPEECAIPQEPRIPKRGLRSEQFRHYLGHEYRDDIIDNKMAACPPPGGGAVGVGDKRTTKEDALASKERTLDGFMLLTACGVEFPDEAHRADVSGRNITRVVSEDLQYFTALNYLDAGDNCCAFEDFSCLPWLQELRMHCNALRTIAEPLSDARVGFEALQTLDLSFNALDTNSLRLLSRLPHLQELDLTCNELSDLPPCFDEFHKLRRLSLERNRLDSDDVLCCLALAPQLRHLNLAFNYFTRVPEQATATAADRPRFTNLEVLNLAHIFISREDDIVCLVGLSKLETLILYGNPLTDGTARFQGMSGADGGGGDPGAIMTMASDGRVDGGGVGGVGAAAHGGGMGLGISMAGAGGYRDPTVSRACVEKLHRRAEELSRERLWQRQLQIVTEPPRKHALATGQGSFANYRDFSMAAVGDDTNMPSGSEFRDAGNLVLFGGGGGDDRGETPLASRDGAAYSGAADSLFMTGIDLGGVDVHQRARELEREVEDESGDESDHELEVPATLMRRSMAGGQQNAGDPAKLRSAVMALRYALKHPMTSHHVPRKGETRIDRPNAVHKARQRPRHQFELRDQRKAQAEAQRKKEAAKSALASIERVLDSMNERIQNVGEDLGAATQSDEKMASLVKMVNNVMVEFEK